MGFKDHLMVNVVNFLVVLSECPPVFGFWPLEEDTLTHLAAFLKSLSSDFKAAAIIVLNDHLELAAPRSRS